MTQELVSVEYVQDVLEKLGIDAEVVNDGYNDLYLRVTKGADQLVIFANMDDRRMIPLPVQSATFNNTATLAGALDEQSRTADFEGANDAFSFLAGVMRSML